MPSVARQENNGNKKGSWSLKSRQPLGVTSGWMKQEEEEEGEEEEEEEEGEEEEEETKKKKRRKRKKEKNKREKKELRGVPSSANLRKSPQDGRKRRRKTARR